MGVNHVAVDSQLIARSSNVIQQASCTRKIHLYGVNSSISTRPYANGLQANVTLNERLQALIDEAKWLELKE